MKKVLKYIILTVVLLAELYSGIFLLLRNVELTLALALFILAATTLAILIYHIVNDIRICKRIKKMNELLEAERKEERVKELLDAIGCNKYGE